jgi:hypothetical protein
VKNPCEICLVKAMCKKPCIQLIDYTEYRMSHSILGNLEFIMIRAIATRLRIKPDMDFLVKRDLLYRVNVIEGSVMGVEPVEDLRDE